MVTRAAIAQWLREKLYHTRQVASEAVRPKVSPKRPTPKPLRQHQTAADALDWLCYRLKATEYRIMREPNGAVWVLVHMQDHSVISSGLANSVPAAVAALVERFQDKLK